jgi:hypothetical protein
MATYLGEFSFVEIGISHIIYLRVKNRNHFFRAHVGDLKVEVRDVVQRRGGGR